MAGVVNPNIFCVVEGLIREAAPLNEVDEVGHHVHDAFALLGDIEEPGGAGKGAAGDRLIPAVDAGCDDAGILGSAVFLCSVDGGYGAKFALENAGDLVAFGHDIIEQKVFGCGGVECLQELAECLVVNDHRFVGEDVEAAFERSLNIGSFLAVVAGEDNSIPFLIADHLVHITHTGIDMLVPAGGILLPGVVGAYFFEMGFDIGARRGVDVYVRIHVGVHGLLDQGCVKMARVEGDEVDGFSGWGGGRGGAHVLLPGVMAGGHQVEDEDGEEKTTNFHGS